MESLSPARVKAAVGRWTPTGAPRGQSEGSGEETTKCRQELDQDSRRLSGRALSREALFSQGSPAAEDKLQGT